MNSTKCEQAKNDHATHKDACSSANAKQSVAGSCGSETKKSEHTGSCGGGAKGHKGSCK